MTWMESLQSPEMSSFLGLTGSLFCAQLYGMVRRSTVRGYAVVFLPSLLAHELCHYIVALCLGGRPRLPRFWPRRVRTIEGRVGLQLGSVEFCPTPLSAVPCAMAPLLLIPIAWLIYTHWAQWFPVSGPHLFGLHMVLFWLICAALPSRADWLLALRHGRSLMLWILVSAIVVFATKGLL